MNKIFMMILSVIFVASVVHVVTVNADDLKGSCVWGAVDYKSDCEGFCKERGYTNGHCGSFANVNCWCET